MSWLAAPDSHFFSPGDYAQLGVDFYAVPFTVGPEEVRAMASRIPGFTPSDHRASLWNVIPGRQVWTITGLIQVSQLAADLRAAAIERINVTWTSGGATVTVYRWSATVGDLIPQATTQTAVSLASLAILALVVFILIARFT